MHSNPKIIVLKTREIIYTLLLLSFLALLIVCLILMFSPEKKEPVSTEQATLYTPGVYTTAVTLGESAANVEVTVESDRIHSIRLINLSETAAVSFPLVSPSLDHIAQQILEKQKLEGITCPQENRYTSQLLLSAVADALETALRPSDTQPALPD